MHASTARTIVIACSIGIVTVLAIWVVELRAARHHALALPTGVVLAPPNSYSARETTAAEAMPPDDAPTHAEASAATHPTSAVLADEGVPEPVPVQRLAAFLPATLGTLRRIDTRVERDETAGSPATVALARYLDGGGEIELRITDIGGPRGIVALAGWALTEDRDTATEDGVEQVWRTAGRVHYRQYDNATSSGEAAVLLGQRFAVTASARGRGLPEIAGALGRVDLAGLEALARMR